MITVHSQDGRHFLGLRAGRQGGYEIVYDGGPRCRRFVWLIKTAQIDVHYIHRNFEEAIQTDDVPSKLYAALRSAEIEFVIDYD